MNFKNSKNMLETKGKAKKCSTPETIDSPSRDSDSLYDSDSASPVPFFCTQDGTEGQIDVVWNFYTPKAEQPISSCLKNSTPVSRKVKKQFRQKPLDKPLPKRKSNNTLQKNKELIQDLIEINQNIHQLIKKEPQVVSDKKQSGSEDDIFSDSPDQSPKSERLRNPSRCLRKNLLCSKFNKPEAETALESDDSMNECLIKASQVVEDNINYEPTPAKKVCYSKNSSINQKALQLTKEFKIDQEAIDAIFNSFKLDSPIISKTKKIDSPCLNNDSFDSLVGNLNDSALERLTQMPVKGVSCRKKDIYKNDYEDWSVNDIVIHDSSPISKTLFGRHSSMPESPSLTELNKPSTSGMVFGRHNSMQEKRAEPSDSPIRCTPDEIRRKHQQAREKLHAKRLLPFTTSQQSNLPAKQSHNILSTQSQFQQKTSSYPDKSHDKKVILQNQNSNKDLKEADIKGLIEKKRQEALMKLRRRQPLK